MACPQGIKYVQYQHTKAILKPGMEAGNEITPQCTMSIVILFGESKCNS